MPDINHLAVIAASVISFALGALWYSPLLFLEAWLKAAGKEKQTGHSPIVFLVSFILTLISCYTFASWLGPSPELIHATMRGVAVGACFVAASFGVNNRFAAEPLNRWAIDGGYHVVRFALFGIVLGLWH